MADDFAAAVLLVDSDPGVARGISGYLTDRDYSVESVDDGEKAFNRLDRHEFDVLVTELNAPRVDGMRLMSVAKDRNRDMCVVLIAEYADIALATEAMRQGAYDFQIKPINLGKLEAVIQRGLEYQRLVFRQHELRRRLDESYGLGNLVGNSRPMVRVYNGVRVSAPLDTPVLIQGEPGTGKDLIAQAIHTNSGRRDEPFVKVQCGGGPAGRLDRELLGSSPGPGRIERADKGTLYLDEVNELGADMQKAVRTLIEKRRTQRLGATRSVGVDVRIIAAVNEPVGEPFDRGLLDLLKATVVEVPALRDRQEDIPLLVHHFLREFSQLHGVTEPSITRNALDLLLRYDWPGNVRELRNVIEGMVSARHGAQTLDVGDFPQFIRKAAKPAAGEIRVPLGSKMTEVERIMIEETMIATGYNKEACAKTLGIGLRTLYRKLDEYGDPPSSAGR